MYTSPWNIRFRILYECNLLFFASYEQCLVVYGMFGTKGIGVIPWSITIFLRFKTQQKTVWTISAKYENPRTDFERPRLAPLSVCFYVPIFPLFKIKRFFGNSPITSACTSQKSCYRASDTLVSHRGLFYRAQPKIAVWGRLVSKWCFSEVFPRLPERSDMNTSIFPLKKKAIVSHYGAFAKLFHDVTKTFNAKFGLLYCKICNKALEWSKSCILLEMDLKGAADVRKYRPRSSREIWRKAAM